MPRPNKFGPIIINELKRRSGGEISIENICCDTLAKEIGCSQEATRKIFRIITHRPDLAEKIGDSELSIWQANSMLFEDDRNEKNTDLMEILNGII